MRTYTKSSLPENVNRWILFGVIMSQSLVVGVPDGPAYHLFPMFPDATMVVTSWAWVIVENIAFLVHSFLWWRNTKRVTVAALHLVCWGNALDFVLTGNHVWFQFGWYPMTNNVFFPPLYLILVEVGWWMESRKHNIAEHDNHR